MPVGMIAAVAENGVIGRDGDLPWRLPSDLARFKGLTLGNTVVMGRRTHESIGRPLPGRRTIVVTSQAVAGMETASTLPEAIARALTPVFLAGGAGIYREGMAYADTLHITRVHARPEGDTFFPPIPPDFHLSAAEPGMRSERDDAAFTYETYVRTTGLD
jgi:dihydrofolate reductase